ncbi:uncharacterized protein C6orf118 [Latimeria chalumnae]|uniref:uncharacterized protein C6orf118 n=1 Tax=Latimeria chalumnae TaxID=7897 RepID=UPI00313F0841
MIDSLADFTLKTCLPSEYLDVHLASSDLSLSTLVSVASLQMPELIKKREAWRKDYIAREELDLLELKLLKPKQIKCGRSADQQTPDQYQFVQSYLAGLTRKDQFRMRMSFDNQFLRKQDLLERNVMSGYKAVEKHERKLRNGSLPVSDPSDPSRQLYDVRSSLKETDSESTLQRGPEAVAPCSSKLNSPWTGTTHNPWVDGRDLSTGDNSDVYPWRETAKSIQSNVENPQPSSFRVLPGELMKIGLVCRPHFGRLQVFRDVFGDICNESILCGDILKEIKKEYDVYLEALLDSQPAAQYQTLQAQLQTLERRAVSTEEVKEAMLRVRALEQEARDALQRNEEIRNELESELLVSKPPDEDGESVPQRTTDNTKEEPHSIGIADQVQAKRCRILIILEELQELKKDIRENMSLAMCAHNIDNCIKDTEVCSPDPYNHIYCSDSVISTARVRFW